jgi:hypothetical protein
LEKRFLANYKHPIPDPYSTQTGNPACRRSENEACLSTLLKEVFHLIYPKFYFPSYYSVFSIAFRAPSIPEAPQQVLIRHFFEQYITIDD